MRILHVSDGYPPRLGGIELHVQELVTRQRAAGMDAHVITTTHQDDNAPRWVHAASTRGSPAALAELAPDMVHLHLSVVSPFAVRFARAAARTGIAMTVTVHSMWTGWGPAPALVVAALGGARSASVWSAVSTPAAAAVAQVLGAHATVHTLGNAVDVDLWRPPVTAPSQPTPPGPGRTVTIVSVMRLTRTKRTAALAEILVDVRRQLPGSVSLNAVVIGEGPQFGKLRRRLAHAGADSWVHLTGRLDRDSIREHLRTGDVFLAPADREAFGIAALEARTAGLAVVASSRSGIADFVSHGHDGLLADHDTAMARAVAALAGDPALLKRIKTHNAIHPPTHDWQRVLDGIDALYDLAQEQAAARGRCSSAPSRPPVLA